MPLSLRIVVGVVLGCVAGWLLGPQHASRLGDVGMLVIRLLKALAGPLVFFAVLDAFLQHEIRARKGVRLVAIGLVNATVAIAIGLTVAHVLDAGRAWQGRIGTILQQIAPAGHAGATKSGQATLDPFANIAQYVPETVLDPFVHNNVVSIVLFAIFAGIALRQVRTRGSPEVSAGIGSIATTVHAGLQVWITMLEWVVWTVPFAVFAIVASVVARTGVRVFAILGPFLLTVVLGLAIHVFVYYALVLRFVGARSPLRFYRDGADAIVTALSSGSSLATLPVTLRVLRDRHKVSDDSARLAACVGTNLNHDGIILYEAGAAIFVSQAFGLALGLGKQLTIAFAAVMAGIGIAGVPEAGLITLPLVLSAARVPDSLVALVIPLLLPLDWILGRCRAATNVISDMTVAVLLDRLSGRDQTQPAPTGVPLP
jgi:Na+/H+-dicarboxylate symporter